MDVLIVSNLSSVTLLRFQKECVRCSFAQENVTFVFSSHLTRRNCRDLVLMKSGLLAYGFTTAVTKPLQILLMVNMDRSEKEIRMIK